MLHVLSLCWINGINLRSSLISFQPHKIQAEAMMKRIRLLAESIWPNAQVQAYGSYATSLSIIASDLDLLIIGATATYAGEEIKDLVLNSKAPHFVIWPMH
jgi:DNA polymerase sigma